MKIFAFAVLVVIAGEPQAMDACVDTMPDDNICTQYNCASLASAGYCNNEWGTCSSATGAISGYCQESCGTCPTVVVAPVPAPAPACAGDAYSEEACRQVATSLGLSQGGGGYAMVGNYGTKGCYAYKSGKYAGMAYYGKCDDGLWGLVTSIFDEGCRKQMEEIPSGGEKYRPNGYDCSVGCHPYSEDACRNAASNLGLALGGGGYGFVGSYSNKGCYAYSSGKYSGKAYYSTGGNNADMAKSLSGAMYRPAGFDCN